MPHLHFMLDAYGTIEENANNLMAVNELLNKVATELNIRPVMPPFLVPYYYCMDAEDGGISAFVLCAGGHITIHTFPFRSCYFVDILSDEFFSSSEAENLFRRFLYADNIKSNIIDRRTIYYSTETRINTNRDVEIDVEKDFGPHYMIEVNGMEMTMSWIYTFLDTIAEKINMSPITRPYVIFDKKENPQYISGILIVAQSHIAVHYDIATKKALVDIFSCAFLDDRVLQDILKDYFKDSFSCKLFSRGSKHNYNYKRKDMRVKTNSNWRTNIIDNDTND